jgi:hypothetical protein
VGSVFEQLGEARHLSNCGLSHAFSYACDLRLKAYTILSMKVWILRVWLLIVCVAGCTQNQGNFGSGLEGQASLHPYNKPLSTPGARFGSLPQNVQTTVLSEAGTAEIADVVKEIEEGQVIYKIYFKESDTFPPLFVAADGSVLNSDLTVAVPARQVTANNLKLSDLPLNVSKVVQERAPNAEIASISKETWGNHIVYIITFKDEARNPKLHIVADGTILHQS